MSQNNHYPIAVILTCKDVKRTLDFYRGTLGFELEQCWPDEEHPLWANLVLDQQSVMVGALMPAEALEKSGCSGEDMSWAKAQIDEMQSNRVGVGIQVFIAVPDVDAHYEKVKGKGATTRYAPTDRFYGIRDYLVEDPDGYRLIFYKAITLAECQSCGMPLADAKPGQMYCGYCTDEQGNLKPYEAVLEGTTQGYFMGMKKMARPEAEKAARDHLAKMPAWSTRQ